MPASSTGKADFSIDLIASKEAAKVVEVSGFAGYEFRGNPDGFDIPTSAFRWGAGAGFPSRSPVEDHDRAERLSCRRATRPRITTRGASRRSIGSVPPITSNTENLTRATVALTFQAPNGFFIGGGLSWNVPRLERQSVHTDVDPFADYWDWQVRIGYHPGVRVYVAAASATAAAAATAGAAHRTTSR